MRTRYWWRSPAPRVFWPRWGRNTWNSCCGRWISPVTRRRPHHAGRLGPSLQERQGALRLRVLGQPRAHLTGGHAFMAAEIAVEVGALSCGVLPLLRHMYYGSRSAYRLVAANRSFVAFCPVCAFSWEGEVWLLARRHVRHAARALLALSELAALLNRVLQAVEAGLRLQHDAVCSRAGDGSCTSRGNRAAAGAGAEGWLELATGISVVRQSPEDAAASRLSPVDHRARHGPRAGTLLNHLRNELLHGKFPAGGPRPPARM